MFHAGPRLVGSLVSAFSCPFTLSFRVETPVALPFLFFLFLLKKTQTEKKKKIRGERVEKKKKRFVDHVWPD